MHSKLEQDRLHVAVDALILTEVEGKLNVLLSRRKDPPCEGCWSLPGRLVGLEESAEEAVANLLQEMLPVQSAYQEQLFTFTDVRRDERGRVISVAYLVIVPSMRLQTALAGSGSSLRLFSVATGEDALALDGEGIRLTGSDLAFDHGQILTVCVGRLRGKIEYTDIGFPFLNEPQAFALGELQRVFEAVLGRQMDASNFRRFVAARYESTGRIEQTDMAGRGRRGRPAALYRWIG